MAEQTNVRVCMNEHLLDKDVQNISSRNLAGRHRPQPTKEETYCDKCGEKAITHCPQCDSQLEGEIDKTPSHREGWYQQTVNIPFYCSDCGCEFPWREEMLRRHQQARSRREDLEYDPIPLVRQICERFHLLAKQIRRRYDDRQSIDIEDEYDVQDLFHSVLRLFFDDVRPEEATQSHAGGSSRIDFLIPKFSIGIEIKYAHDHSDARQFGDELSIDKNRYPVHPDCETLIFFIYDSDHVIPNPQGLENDLIEELDETTIEAVVAPKGH